jgi:hypothetical protein
MMIDINLIRIQYEVFGESEQKLAEQYNMTPLMIRYMAEEHGFKRLPVANPTPTDWTQQEAKDVEDHVLADVNKRLAILNTLKSQTLSPQYISIETAILSKMQSILQNMNIEDPLAASRLKTIAESFLSLRQGTVPSKEGAAAGEAGTKVVVNIMGQVPKDYQTAEYTQVRIANARDLVGPGTGLIGHDPNTIEVDVGSPD